MIKYFKFDGVLFDFIHKCPLKYQAAKPAKYLDMRGILCASLLTASPALVLGLHHLILAYPK